MAKRLKRVYSTADQVLHLWTNQSQSDARCKNVFFEGTKVWSYGRHYLLGQLHEFNGVRIALINNHRVSVTTAKHQSYANSATSHMPTLSVADPSDSSKKAIREAMLSVQYGLVQELMGFFSKRSFWGEKLDEYDTCKAPLQEFNSNCDALGFKELKIAITEDFKKLMQAHLTLACRRKAELQSPEAIANRELARQKRELLAIKKLENQAIAWRNGGPLVEGLRKLPIMLRVYGNEVQTTRGASVPLTDAKTMLKRIMAGHAESGDVIGSFTFNSITNGIVKIGCHQILLTEAINVLKEGAL